MEQGRRPRRLWRGAHKLRLVIPHRVRRRRRRQDGMVHGLGHHHHRNGGHLPSALRGGGGGIARHRLEGLDVLRVGHGGEMVLLRRGLWLVGVARRVQEVRTTHHLLRRLRLLLHRIQHDPDILLLRRRLKGSALGMEELHHKKARDTGPSSSFAFVPFLSRGLVKVGVGNWNGTVGRVRWKARKGTAKDRTMKRWRGTPKYMRERGAAGK